MNAGSGSGKSRRPEKVTVLIILPITYNPDRSGRRKSIEERKYIVTLTEISGKFGGGVFHNYTDAPPAGFWFDKGILYIDTLCFIEVDIRNTRKSRNWMKKYVRDTLLKRFCQKAIYVKLVGPIETLEVSEFYVK